MIYTVTFNPSLDYLVHIDDYKPGEVNRMSFEQIYPGGKGINVSIVLKELGCESTALGFAAGFTGDEIHRQLQETGVRSDFIRLPSGNSRINVKLKTPGSETDMNGQGPEIPQDKIDELFARLDTLTENDFLVISGSIPGSLPDDIYEQILKRLKGKSISAAVDATGELLTNVLPYHPFLVKPNHHELGEIFGTELKSREDVVPYARKMQIMGAQNVLVSMAGEGAVLAAADGAVYQSEAPKGTVRNSVGAGDSMVAGFLAGYLKNRNYEEAFHLGLAAGSATAFSDGLASGENIRSLAETLQQHGGKAE